MPLTAQPDESGPLDEPVIEEIGVEPMPEPDKPEDGVIDPDDTYVEGED